jgi:hypothetical protein
MNTKNTNRLVEYILNDWTTKTGEYSDIKTAALTLLSLGFTEKEINGLLFPGRF